jgi:phenylpropionate dioxygenase-like ring-hydroxylating dioxygenase large terminal subunit
MGADLAQGCVKDGRLACPLHGWEYATDGRCESIPASPNIPAFARQVSFPVAERGGHLFFYNRPTAPFPLPFFSGVEESDLHPARPFELIIDTPWYLVGANGFDMQHFRCSHDRTVVGQAEVDFPHDHAWRMRASFEVTGTALADRLTKWFSGTVVEMAVENWGGALLLVTARFRRTTTYGLVSLVPLENHQTRVRDIVWVERSQNPLSRRLLDPINAEIRRFFIREFLLSDVTRSSGIRFHPSRMIPEDQVMTDFLHWLHKLHRGTRSEP